MVHISEEQLKKILELHGDWLASEGKEGKQAYLYEANLKGADLTNTVGLTNSRIESAITDDKTRLPNYLSEPLLNGK